MFSLQTSFKSLERKYKKNLPVPVLILLKGLGGVNLLVEVTVNSKEENSLRFLT